MGEQARVVELRTSSSRYFEEAQEVLALAQEECFESVIVMGFKDGLMHIKSSPNKSTLEIFGSLEAAKMQLWRDGQ